MKQLLAGEKIKIFQKSTDFYFGTQGTYLTAKGKQRKDIGVVRKKQCLNEKAVTGRTTHRGPSPQGLSFLHG